MGNSMARHVEYVERAVAEVVPGFEIPDPFVKGCLDDIPLEVCFPEHRLLLRRITWGEGVFEPRPGDEVHRFWQRGHIST